MALNLIDSTTETGVGSAPVFWGLIVRALEEQTQSIRDTTDKHYSIKKILDKLGLLKILVDRLNLLSTDPLAMRNDLARDFFTDVHALGLLPLIYGRTLLDEYLVTLFAEQAGLKRNLLNGALDRNLFIRKVGEIPINGNGNTSVQPLTVVTVTGIRVKPELQIRDYLGNIWVPGLALVTNPNPGKVRDIPAHLCSIDFVYLRKGAFAEAGAAEP